MSEARGLGRETLWYGAANIVSGAISLVTLYLFTRLLTPAEFGAFSLILAWASFITAAACAWINQTLKRYYVSLEGAAREEFMGRIAAAYLLTGAVSLVVTALVSAVLALFHQPGWLPWPILGLAIGTAAPQYVQWLFSIRREAAGYAINQVLYNVSRLLLGWLMLRFLAATGEMLAWSMTIAGLLTGVEGWLALRERYSFGRPSFAPAGLLPLWLYGWPLTMVNGGLWLMNSAGRVILEPLAGPGAVGIYSAGQGLSLQVAQLAVTPVVTAADPLAIRIHTRDGAAATARFLSQLLGLLLLLGSGVCLVLVLLAGPITAAMWPPEYSAAAGLFVYFAPAMLLSCISPVLLKSQEIGEKLGELPWLMLGAGALNIALNFALIPQLGMTGAAVSLLVANAALGAVCYWRGREHLAWPLPWKTLALTVPCLAALTGLVIALPTPQGKLQCALAFSGYMLGYLGLCAVAMLALRGVFNDELAFVKQVASRRVSR